jgi:hypothetical protein
MKYLESRDEPVSFAGFVEIRIPHDKSYNSSLARGSLWDLLWVSTPGTKSCA